MTILYAAYKQLQWLYADWVDGIRVKTADPSSEQRVAPLRLLEHQLRTKTHVAPWRSGNKMAKAVAERKVLVYAILRRLFCSILCECNLPNRGAHLAVLLSLCLLQHTALLHVITHALSRAILLKCA